MQSIKKAKDAFNSGHGCKCSHKSERVRATCWGIHKHGSKFHDVNKKSLMWASGGVSSGPTPSCNGLEPAVESKLQVPLWKPTQAWIKRLVISAHFKSPTVWRCISGHGQLADLESRHFEWKNKHTGFYRTAGHTRWSRFNSRTFTREESGVLKWLHLQTSAAN